MRFSSVLPNFLLGCPFFKWIHSLHILDTSHLLVLQTMNIYSMVYLFTLVMAFFNEQKVLTSAQSSFSFFLWIVIFTSYLRNISIPPKCVNLLLSNFPKALLFCTTFRLAVYVELIFVCGVS